MSDSDDDQPPSVHFTTAQLAILENHVSVFNAADREGRRKLRKTLRKELQTLSPTVNKHDLHRVSMELPSRTNCLFFGVQAISTWLKNRSGKREKTGKAFVVRSWSAKQVFGELHREEINAAARQVSKVTNGANFLAARSKELQERWSAVPEEDRESFQEMAAKWKAEKPPVATQRRYSFLQSQFSNFASTYFRNVQAKASQWTREFAESMFAQAGMRVFVLAACKSEDGSIELSRCVCPKLKKEKLLTL